MIPTESGVKEDTIWTPVADMMTALMVVFMVLVLALTTKLSGELDADEALQAGQAQLQDSFGSEFGEYAEVEGAFLDTMNLAIRFYDDAATFGLGSTTIEPEFRNRLDELIPKVVKYVTSDSIWPLISEIRIEGHTSSEWNEHVSEEEAYLLNMELSQGRTRAVLTYFLRHEAINRHSLREHIRSRLTANGLSSSHPILDSLGKEDTVRSRRVEIRFQQKRDREAIELIRRRHADQRMQRGFGSNEPE